MVLGMTRIKLNQMHLIEQVEQRLLLEISPSFCFSVITNQMLLQYNYILMQKKKEKKVLLRSVSAV